VASSTDDLHGSSSRRYERIPANEIIHVFVAEDAEQWRGAPWAYAALRRARQLDQFEEAALVAANVGAAKMGFLQQTDPEAGPISDGDGTETGGVTDFVQSAEPGAFEKLPDGYTLKEWDPNYPSDNFDPFVKSVMRSMATGLLVSYHGVSGDLTEVNFSSIRAGTLDEREFWKTVQNFIVDTVKVPVFEWWLARALVWDPDLRGLPPAKFDKFNRPVFFGRRWEWVDPKSDVAADREAVALGIKSRAQIISERGRDPADVWAELEAEEARGLKTPARSSAAPPAKQQETD
jgi:lambda family phage portal protein